MSAAVARRHAAGVAVGETAARCAARRCGRSCARRPFLVGSRSSCVLGRLRAVRLAHRAPRPVRDDLLDKHQPPSARALVRHRPARPRRLLPRHRRRARHPDRSRRSRPCSARCSAPRSGWSMGYFRGLDRRRPVSRIVEAFLALPLVDRRAPGAGRRSAPRRVTVIVVIGFVFAPIIARTVRAAVLRSASSTTSRRRGCAASAAYIMFVEILPNVHAADPGRVHGAARLRDLRRRHAVASSASASSRRRPTGACRSPTSYGMICGGLLVGGRCSRRSPSPRW